MRGKRRQRIQRACRSASRPGGIGSQVFESRLSCRASFGPRTPGLPVACATHGRVSFGCFPSHALAVPDECFVSDLTSRLISPLKKPIRPRLQSDFINGLLAASPAAQVLSSPRKHCLDFNRWKKILRLECAHFRAPEAAFPSHGGDQS